MKKTIDHLINRRVLSLSLVLCGSSTAQAMDLAQVIQLTQTSHPSVQAQRSLVEVAHTDVETAQQQFLPTPSVAIEQVQASATDVSYRGNATVQTYRLQQPVWTAGRLTASVDKAQANEQAAWQGYQDTVQQMSLRAVQAWGEWFAAHLKRTVLDRAVAAHQTLYDQVKRRVEEGASAPVELVLTEGRLAQMLSQRQAVQAQWTAARLKVAQLIGQPIDADDIPTQHLQFQPAGLPQLEQEALAQSPALQRLQAQQSAQQAELREREAELWPELYVRAEHVRNQYANSALTSAGENRLYFGLSSRLGAGLSSWKVMESLQKRLLAAQAEQEANRRVLQEQVQTDWESRQSLAMRIPALEKSLEATRSTSEAWSRQFLAGRKSWLEVMNAERELMQADLELVDAKATLTMVEWRLALLSQGVEKILQNRIQTANTASQAVVVEGEKP